MTKRPPSITLNNGVEMPALGLGVYQVPDAAECKRVVLDALELGYRHIDTAGAYGNEKAVGQAIRESGLPRGDIFVTTKLWLSHTGEAKTTEAFHTSLEKLGLNYLDLYLIHQPFGDLHGSWRAMEALNKQGLCRAIGVSNFHADRLMDLIAFNEIVPAVNQIETHPFFQRSEDHAFMKKHGIQHESWAPFAEGMNNLFADPILSQLADKHGKSVAQVVLRWLIQRDVLVIPKSVRPERMKENIAVFDFELSIDDMALIAGMDTGASLFFSHRDAEKVAWLASMR